MSGTRDTEPNTGLNSETTLRTQNTPDSVTGPTGVTGKLQEVDGPQNSIGEMTQGRSYYSVPVHDPPREAGREDRTTGSPTGPNSSRTLTSNSVPGPATQETENKTKVNKGYCFENHGSLGDPSPQPPPFHLGPSREGILPNGRNHGLSSSRCRVEVESGRHPALR